MGKIGGSLWVKNLLLKTTPPPEKLSYPHKFRVLALFVLFALVFAFSGCTDSTNGGDNNSTTPPTEITNTYTETVNNFTWTVEFTSNGVKSIYASNTENDRSSSYWEFSRVYHGDSNLPVKHSVILSGTPLDDNWFLIVKTEKYIMSASSTADLERVRKTYPSCTQDSDSFAITLSEQTTRYEEKIVFSLPS